MTEKDRELCDSLEKIGKLTTSLIFHKWCYPSIVNNKKIIQITNIE